MKSPVSKNVRFFLSAGAIAISVASVAPAMAQDAASDDADAAVADAAPAADAPAAGEIVVTAQKRTERLVEVPIALTAVSGDSLADAQINDTASLSKAVPSLTFQQGNNPNNSSFRIRGIGTQLFGQGVEPAVSVVVDGVVAARAAQGFSDLADVERIEVLRGPQGTLFGKNATAGVINIVTLAPDDYFNGKFDVTVAEQDEYRVKGTVTGPITQDISARISGFYNNVGGHIRNVALNKDTNGYESWGVRGKLAWKNGGPLDALLIAEYRKTDADCCSRVPVSITTPAVQTLLGDIDATPGNRQVSNDGASFSKSTLKSASLQLNYDLGPATITSISAWQRWESNDQFEPDQLYTDPIRYVGAFNYSQWNNNASFTNYDNYSEELRIASNGYAPVTYVAGVYLSKLDMTRGLERRLTRCTAGTEVGELCDAPLVNLSSGFLGEFHSKSASAFGQADWNVAGGLHVLGGLRVAHEKQSVTGERFAPLDEGDLAFPPSLGPDSGTSSRSDTAVTGKAGVRYEFDRNTNVYASYTRGYKAFALDIDIGTTFSNNQGLEPEHVDAYEAGLKMRTFDGALDLNLAIFRSDATNLQVQAIEQIGGNFLVRQLNAGSSRSQGFEAEATLRPSDWLSIPIGFTYLDATIDVDGQSCAFQQQASAPTYTSDFPVNMCYRRSVTTDGVTTVSNPLIDVKGGKLPLAPKYRVNISPRVDFDLTDSWSGFFLTNVAFQSEQVFAINQDPLLKQNAYTLVDMSLGVTNGALSVTGFVKNLFDTTYYSQLNHGTILAGAANPYDLWANIPKDADRYFGVNVGYKF